MKNTMNSIMKEAMFYEKANANDVHCCLCPVNCTLHPNQQGFCQVRKNKNGILYAESYQLISALALDPIEKKPLARFHPGTKILSVGGYGCNMRCPFCQNHGISMIRPEQNALEILSPKDLVRMAKELVFQGNIGVAFTYNEPFIHYEYILDCAQAVKSSGLLNVLVTNGYVQKEPLLQLLPFIDAMNIDLKGFTETYYKMLKGNLSAIQDTIELAAQHCHVEITTLIVPCENDRLTEMEAMTKWIASVNPTIPLHITRFFPQYNMSNREATPKESLVALKEVAQKNLQYVYLGNC